MKIYAQVKICTIKLCWHCPSKIRNSSNVHQPLNEKIKCDLFFHGIFPWQSWHCPLLTAPSDCSLLVFFAGSSVLPNVWVTQSKTLLTLKTLSAYPQGTNSSTSSSDHVSSCPGCSLRMPSLGIPNSTQKSMF